MTTIHRDAELNEGKILDVDGICKLQPLSIIMMDDLLLYSFGSKIHMMLHPELQTQSSNRRSVLQVQVC